MNILDASAFDIRVGAPLKPGSPPMLAIVIHTMNGDQTIVPMSIETADNLATVLATHVAAIEALTVQKQVTQ